MSFYGSNQLDIDGRPSESQTFETYSLSEISHAMKYQNSENSANKIEIQGGYAYVASSAYKILIYDISDPQNIQLVDDITTGQAINDIQVVDNFLYVSIGPNRLIVYDISDPNNAVFYNEYLGFDDNIRSFKVFGDKLIATLANGQVNLYQDGQWIPDLPDSTFSLNNVFVMEKIGNFLYLGATGMIAIYNISDFSDPQFTSSFLINGMETIKSMTIFGNYLFAGTDGDNFYCFDIFNTDNSDNINIGNVHSIAIQNHYAYLANGDFITILNISDPLDLNIYARLNIETTIHCVNLFGIYLLLGTYNDFYTIQIGEHIEPQVILNDSQSSDYKTYISGFYAFIAMGWNGLYIYDMRSTLLVSHILNMDWIVKDVYVEGDIAYILETNGTDGRIHYYNISDIHNPMPFKQYNGITSNSRRIRIIDNLMLVAQVVDGLKILLFEDRTNLYEGPQINSGLNGYVYDANMHNNTLYLADYNFLRVFDMTDLFTPNEVKSIELNYHYSTELDFPFLFVGTNAGVRIFNISNYQALDEINQIDYPIPKNTMDLKRNGNLIYTAAHGPMIYNISQYEANDLIFSPESGSARSISVQGDIIVYTDSMSGHSISKIMEVGGDDVGETGIPFLERYWGQIPIEQDGGEVGDTDDGDGDNGENDDEIINGDNNGGNGEQNNNELPNIDPETILMILGPIALIFVIINVAKRGKQKKIKNKRDKGQSNIEIQSIMKRDDDIFEF